MTQRGRALSLGESPAPAPPPHHSRCLRSTWAASPLCLFGGFGVGFFGLKPKGSSHSPSCECQTLRGAAVCDAKALWSSARQPRYSKTKSKLLQFGHGVLSQRQVFSQNPVRQDLA